jgi:hypothetical protein
LTTARGSRQLDWARHAGVGRGVEAYEWD